MDYKYSIQLQAEEIAFRDYGKEFYDLTQDLQTEVYNKAESIVSERLREISYGFKG